MVTEAIAGAAETPEEFIKRRDAAIATWLDRRDALNSIKPKELEARNSVASILFPEPKKGTNRYHLNSGYAIKMVYGINYTLGDKDKIVGEGEDAVKVSVTEQVRGMLANLYNLLVTAKGEEEANKFCNTIVKWKPELDEKTYLAIDTTDNVMAVAKGIIDEILTVSPATPQMTFEIPKEKR